MNMNMDIGYVFCGFYRHSTCGKFSQMTTKEKNWKNKFKKLRFSICDVSIPLTQIACCVKVNGFVTIYESVFSTFFVVHGKFWTQNGKQLFEVHLILWKMELIRNESKNMCQSRIECGKFCVFIILNVVELQQWNFSFDRMTWPTLEKKNCNL